MKGILLDLPSVGIILGIIHAIFLAVFLLSINNGRTLSFIVLAALLVAMSVGMAGSIFYQFQIFSTYPVLGFLFPANEFFYGPLFICTCNPCTGRV